jgi:hypothetical protein
MSVRVFISGPYSTGDQVENMRAALDAAEKCMKVGLVPFVPHLNGFWHFVYPHSYEEWLAYDLEWLELCDILWRLPGDSVGANREMEWAISNGMLGCASFEDVLAVAKRYYDFEPS